MSATSHVDRCRELLQEQLEGLGALRTANSRDLSFKNWRQNTVTVLQRIWPEDRERVERFRRIVFTPPHTRADAKLTREWFGKGIGESRTYLNSLLEIIDREGVPPPTEAARERDGRALEEEVDFPMLELPGDAGSAPPAADDAPRPGDESGLGVTPGYTSPDEQGATRRDPQAPAPPALNMRWDGAPAPAPGHHTEEPAEVPPALDPVLDDAIAADLTADEDDDEPSVEIPLAPTLVSPGEPPPTPPAAAASVPAAPAAPPAAPKAAPKPAPPAAAVAPAAAAAPPAAPKPAPPAKPAAPAASRPARTATPAPAPAAAAAPEPPRREAGSRVTTRGKSGRGKHKKGGPRPKLKDLLGLDELESRVQESPPEPEPEVEVAAAVEPPAPAAEPRAEMPPAAEEEDFEEDDEDVEQATLDFMNNSPVFGLVGKPVQRRTDTTEHTDPDAVAVATLAADLGRLGVPDAMKASLGARLEDVAKHLEDDDLEWVLLRAAITDALQYPELARRLLPVLLPWLERAA